MKKHPVPLHFATMVIFLLLMNSGVYAETTTCIWTGESDPCSGPRPESISQEAYNLCCSPDTERRPSSSTISKFTQKSSRTAVNYPPLATLVSRDSTPVTGQVCTGVLIRPRWVLTAAGCLAFKRERNEENLEVIIGAQNLNEDTGERIVVERTFAHGGQSNVLRNNIGLIHLAQASTITPAVLATEDEFDALTAPGQQLTVIDRHIGYDWDQTLQRIMTVFSHEEADAFYSPHALYVEPEAIPLGLSTPEGLIYFTNSTGTYMMKINAPGGPILASTGNQQKVVGVESWVPSTAAMINGEALVGANLKPYLDWIDQTTRPFIEPMERNIGYLQGGGKWRIPIKFSDKMNLATLNDSTVSVVRRETGQPVPFTITTSGDDSFVYLDLKISRDDEPVGKTLTFSIKIAETVEDTYGRPMGKEHTHTSYIKQYEYQNDMENAWQITTEDIRSTTANQALFTTLFYLTNEAVNSGAVKIRDENENLMHHHGYSAIDRPLSSNEFREHTYFTTDEGFLPGKSYTVEFGSGMELLGGRKTTRPVSLDITIPFRKITLTDPPTLSTNVPRNITIELDTTGIPCNDLTHGKTLSFEKIAGASQPGTCGSFNYVRCEQKEYLKFTPAILDEDSTYRLTIKKDYIGLESDFVLEFSTGDGPSPEIDDPEEDEKTVVPASGRWSLFSMLCFLTIAGVWALHVRRRKYS